jgi:hypothetical protein
MNRTAQRRTIPAQPHFHPQPGPLDGRGNCVGCVSYDPETAYVTAKGVAYVPSRKNARAR